MAKTGDLPLYIYIYTIVILYCTLHSCFFFDGALNIAAHTVHSRGYVMQCCCKVCAATQYIEFVKQTVTMLLHLPLQQVRQACYAVALML
jgi:hypothetical protein